MKERLLKALENELAEGEKIVDTDFDITDLDMERIWVRAIIITPYHNARRVVYYYDEYSGDIVRLNDACGFMDIVRGLI